MTATFTCDEDNQEKNDESLGKAIPNKEKVSIKWLSYLKLFLSYDLWKIINLLKFVSIRHLDDSGIHF